MLGLWLAGCFEGMSGCNEKGECVCIPSLRRGYRLVGGLLCRLFRLEWLWRLLGCRNL